MTEPLKRDEQIKLMNDAKERHDKLFERVLADPLVREVVSSPAPTQVKSAYVHSELRIARYG